MYAAAVTPPADAGGSHTIHAALDGTFKLAVWVGLYCIALIAALSPHIDQDLWWHLRTGQTIVEDGRIPTTDSYSRFGRESGAPWLAYSWLFEALVYLDHKLLGLSGIVLFRLVMVLAIAAAVHRLIAKRHARFVAAAALFGAALFALGAVLTERPWLFTILFFTIELDLLLDLRAGRPSRAQWLLPPLFALWANLHIQFVYGLLILGLACASPLFDHLIPGQAADDPAGRAGSKSWWSLVLLTVLCCLATLFNPYHVRLYGVVLDYGAQQAPWKYLSELQPLAFRNLRDFMAPALGGLALFFLGKRQRRSTFELLALVVAAWFAFRARRDVWFLTLVAVGIIASVRGGPIAALAFVPTRRQALALASVLVVVASVCWRVLFHAEALQDRLAEDYPVESVRFVKAHGCTGPLYNDFDWGGYLIWDLPELLVSMDGRTNLHGDDRVTQNYITGNALPGWDQDPDLAGAQVIIADIAAPLTLALRRDDRFELVHEDGRAAVFQAHIANGRRGLSPP